LTIVSLNDPIGSTPGELELSREVSLSGLMCLSVIVAVLAGAELGGLAAMFLALPAVAIGSVAFRHWLDWDEDAAAPATSTLGPSWCG
jgi:hypothetical protein